MGLMLTEAKLENRDAPQDLHMKAELNKRLQWQGPTYKEPYLVRASRQIHTYGTLLGYIVLLFLIWNMRF